jgi:endopeptidase La
MFPVEFDYRILNTLPVPTAERTGSVSNLLDTILVRRVIPYFKNKRGSDPLRLARAHEQLSILRLEDENNLVRIVSLLTRGDQQWKVQVHERIFDYICFSLPGDADARLGEGPSEEREMLAFAEFFLRHQFEHILYPEHRERDVIIADVDFALYRSRSDPAFYRDLRSALGNAMNGIKGENYLTLIDRGEKGLGLEEAAGAALEVIATSLNDGPDELLREVFPLLDTELKSKVLEDCYRRSRNTESSLLRRAHCLRAVLRLFSLLMEKDQKETVEVFHSFKDRWGLVELFKELELPEKALANKSSEELLELFKAGLLGVRREEALRPPAQPAELGPRRTPEPSERAGKSLKERIEEAANDPAIPPRVLELIDKNKQNAVGYSSSKYSELIETLLAIPWGKIRKIEVSPEAFERGLNLSHYGLQTPKEIICDFFTNLIWRYQRFSQAETATWRRTGSAFLLVGPPGVGKTSLAISVAQNLGVPYHKISLGGMRDETDMRGFGFTYEGSKPGAIVQGLIKMEAMNGMFILDEADKTEKFAIATLLEILDPEQNHLFHDKYTQTTIDIDLSNCHFFLTANTLETVPPVVVNRCEVVLLDRYSIEEKVTIAREYLIRRIREKYLIDAEQLFFVPEEETDLLRHLIRTYTYEPGVRELERIIRTLFLRIQRKEILSGGQTGVRVTRQKIKALLKAPSPPRQIGPEDACGEMLALGVDVERGVGSIIPIQATWIGGETGWDRPHGRLSIVHATGNIEKVMDESRKVATTGILRHATELGIELEHAEKSVHLHFMGGSTRKDGPSAGGAIALALASLLSGRSVRKDVAMTGEIDTKGRITGVGGLALKIETASNAGCKTMIIPRENLLGEEGIERLPEALKEELQTLTYEEWSAVHSPFDCRRHILQVVAVDNIVQAADIAFMDDVLTGGLETVFRSHALQAAAFLRRFSTQPARCLRVLQVKDAGEIGPQLFDIPGSFAAGTLVLLTLPEIRGAVFDRMGETSRHCRVVEFDPRKEKLASAIRKASGRTENQGEPPVGAALIAPYYLLKHDAISTGPQDPDFFAGGIRFFANNYTAQHFKIKRSKALLDRVFSIMALLPPPEIDKCPFLGSLEGIHVVDLSFIPEKYRLDESRAEKILQRGLDVWLESVREELGGERGAEERASFSTSTQA